MTGWNSAFSKRIAFSDAGPKESDTNSTNLHEEFEKFVEFVSKGSWLGLLA